MKKSDTEKEIERLKNALEQKKNENKKLKQQVKYAKATKNGLKAELKRVKSERDEEVKNSSLTEELERVKRAAMAELGTEDKGTVPRRDSTERLIRTCVKLYVRTGCRFRGGERGSLRHRRGVWRGEGSSPPESLRLGEDRRAGHVQGGPWVPEHRDLILELAQAMECYTHVMQRVKNEGQSIK